MSLQWQLARRPARSVGEESREYGAASVPVNTAG